MELTLKIHMHQAKNPVKRMIAKIPIIKKTLFYTDGKQPGGMFNYNPKDMWIDNVRIPVTLQQK